MKAFARKVAEFLASEEGPTAVEYGVMLAMIVVVCLTSIGLMGTGARSAFNTVANSLNGH
jgi:pilus assembly protein Flp/PilA